LDWNKRKDENDSNHARNSHFPVGQISKQEYLQRSLPQVMNETQGDVKLAEVVRQQIDHSSLQAINLRRLRHAKNLLEKFQIEFVKVKSMQRSVK
jgi:hypothetical protein